MNRPLHRSFPLPPLPPSPFKVLPPPKEVLKKMHPFLVMPARFVPFDIQRIVLEKLIRTTFAEAIADGDLEFLEGSWLQIEISDLKLSWYLTLGTLGPIVVAGPVTPDVFIRGNLKEFVALANQQEDPDTLFFQRRLMIEGDTELGLEVKNLLFSTELSGVPKKAARLLQKYMETVEPGAANDNSRHALRGHVVGHKPKSLHELMGEY